MKIRLGIILIGLLAGAGLVISYTMNPVLLSRPQPDPSFVVWKDSSNTEIREGIGGVLNADGLITNTHGEWSIAEVRIEIRAMDGNDRLIETREIAVNPSLIPPGEKGIYIEKVKLPASCVSVDSNVLWEWVSP